MAPEDNADVAAILAAAGVGLAEAEVINCIDAIIFKKKKKKEREMEKKEIQDKYLFEYFLTKTIIERYIYIKDI